MCEVEGEKQEVGVEGGREGGGRQISSISSFQEPL